MRLSQYIMISSLAVWAAGCPIPVPQEPQVDQKHELQKDMPVDGDAPTHIPVGIKRCVPVNELEKTLAENCEKVNHYWFSHAKYCAAIKVGDTSACHFDAAQTKCDFNKNIKLGDTCKQMSDDACIEANGCYIEVTE